MPTMKYAHAARSSLKPRKDKKHNDYSSSRLRLFAELTSTNYKQNAEGRFQSVVKWSVFVNIENFYAPEDFTASLQSERDFQWTDLRCSQVNTPRAFYRRYSL